MTNDNFFSKDYTPEDAWEDTAVNSTADANDDISDEFLKSRKFKTWHKRKAANGDYSCEELGKEWGAHRDTIFKWFESYPGVIRNKYPATKKRRAYTILRIPIEVAARWRKEHTVK